MTARDRGRVTWRGDKRKKWPFLADGKGRGRAFMRGSDSSGKKRKGREDITWTEFGRGLCANQ